MTLCEALALQKKIIVTSQVLMGGILHSNHPNYYLPQCWKPLLVHHTAGAYSWILVTVEPGLCETSAHTLLHCHYMVMPLIFLVAEYIVNTADNKNSLRDASVIAFAKTFYFYILDLSYFAFIDGFWQDDIFASTCCFKNSMQMHHFLCD